MAERNAPPATGATTAGLLDTNGNPIRFSQPSNSTGTISSAFTLAHDTGHYFVPETRMELDSHDSSSTGNGIMDDSLEGGNSGFELFPNSSLLKSPSYAMAVGGLSGATGAAPPARVHCFRPSPPEVPMHVMNQKLKYDVYAWSSYTAAFHPGNIMVNKPSDQSSRWSSGSNNQMQFITIQLEKPCIVHTITFGKFHKVHACNLKEFKVLGGLSPDNLIEVLHSGLRNDEEPETFPLKHKINGVVFPLKFIKIVPLAVWGVNFPYSIWYIELRGISETSIVERATEEYDAYREMETIRLCLKHFRQRNYLDMFDMLQNKTHIQLESKLLTNLYRTLVVDGNFSSAEEMIRHAAEKRMFEEYISSCRYQPVWKRILPTDPNHPQPSMRGGHQMCIDVNGGKIFMMGGWDGTKDLADLWTFDIAEQNWTCISSDTRRQNGPGPRSCHKICFDPAHNQIYTLGRYVEQESRAQASFESDFFRYDVVQNRWYRISADTRSEGGPELIYDHQMCIDSENQIIYVFGGRVIYTSNPENSYSGLYAYNIRTKQWRLIRSDTNQPEHSIQVKSRIGHSMLFNPRERVLYMFAGQRNKDYLSDFYVYDIDNDLVVEMSRDSSKQGGPDAGFTQRATIDIDQGELYVLSGLIREKNTTQESVKNSFWIYNIYRDQWSKIYQNENVDQAYWMRMRNVEPSPRFAHQLVYDHINKIQYLYGGNPGETNNPKLRLDDFWELRLICPTVRDVLRRATFLIRKQNFIEMCRNGKSVSTLRYLQTELSQIVDHSNEKEVQEFHSLATNIFDDQGIYKCAINLFFFYAAIRQYDAFHARNKLYEELLAFFPDFMKQPKGSLRSLVHISLGQS